MNHTIPPRPADSVASSWVDRWLPASMVAYARLARLDRPIGSWLLMWPCWWGVALALAARPGTGLAWPALLLVLFGVGAVAMRGAGCTYNDLVDTDIDARVARTRDRPIPSGQISRTAAAVFLALQSLVGLAVLIAISGGRVFSFTFGLGLASLALVAIYPFMKRVTYWPQLFLGLAFNWGALLGWSAITGGLAAPAIFLYAAGIAWTLGYDTIYAHQDCEDDALIGVKSTAMKFGRQSVYWISGFYGAAVLLWLLAGITANLHWLAYVILAGAAAHLVWQITRLDITRPRVCLMLFRSNRTTGAIVFVAFLAGGLLAGGQILG